MPRRACHPLHGEHLAGDLTSDGNGISRPPLANTVDVKVDSAAITMGHKGLVALAEVTLNRVDSPPHLDARPIRARLLAPSPALFVQLRRAAIKVLIENVRKLHRRAAARARHEGGQFEPRPARGNRGVRRG